MPSVRRRKELCRRGGSVAGAAHAARLGRMAFEAIGLRGEDVRAADGARPVAGAHVARAAAAAEAAGRGEAARRDPRLRRRASEAGLQGRGREGARAMSDARRRGGERGARRATRRTIFDAKTLAWQLGHVQSPGRTSPPPPPKPPSSNCEYGAPPPKPPYAPGSPCTPSSDRPATFAATEAGSSGTGLRERLRAAEGRSPGFRSASRSRAPRGATCSSPYGPSVPRSSVDGSRLSSPSCSPPSCSICADPTAHFKQISCPTSSRSG